MRLPEGDVDQVNIRRYYDIDGMLRYRVDHDRPPEGSNL
jgi:hypothetical protein